jgi:hypothetical protein
MVSTLGLTALFAELKRSNELLKIREASFRHGGDCYVRS